VLKGQLSLGQLVASELILSASFYGISQLGKDFENFYDLAAACEKLSQFYNIAQENNGSIKLTENGLNIRFKEVFDRYLGRDFFFDLEFKSKKNYIVTTESLSTHKVLVELLSGLRKPIRGSLEFNQNNVEDLDLLNLRSKIAIIDNGSFVEGSILENITFNNKLISKKQINDVLHITGFDNVLSRFDNNLLLRITPSGWPLSESEKILLRTVRAVISQPQVIIITEALDMMTLKMRRKILQFLTKNHDATVIYFSNRRDDMIDFDHYLFVGQDETLYFENLEQLDEFEKKNG
jgi:putative ABC transport system ATP-binding protein